MNTTLIIMAAGIGSRFGTGIKQLAKMAPNGEIIMDFSIYDAKEAGFTKVVFVIRKAIEKEFKEVIGNRLSKVMPVEYVYQELEDLPEGYEVPEGRVKPWGTGQAILACKDIVKEPFVIINADDYYGKEAFVKLHDFLVSGEYEDGKITLAMAGFSLKNTLSENGTVTRGVCVADETGYLVKVIETTGIQKMDGKIQCDNAEVEGWITPDTMVSMNMWAGYPDFLQYIKESFQSFLEHLGAHPEKKEYLLLKAFVKGVRGYFSYYLRRFSLCFCLNNAFQSVLSSQTATMVKKHFDFIICFALLNHKNSIRFVFL